LCFREMRRVASVCVRPTSGLRGYAAKAAASPAAAAAASAGNPWSNVPQQEAALRDAILKAMVSGEAEDRAMVRGGVQGAKREKKTCMREASSLLCPVGRRVLASLPSSVLLIARSLLNFFFCSKPRGVSSSPGGQLAKALYTATELAAQTQKSKTDVHAAVARDLKHVSDAMQAVGEWKTFFTSPVISKEDRNETLNELWNGIGASEIVRQFFARLVETKRTKYVKEMLAAYQEIVRAKRGEVEATVVSAVPLSQRQEGELRDMIVDEFLNGKEANVILTKVVDASIMGGFTLTVGSTYLDKSVRTRFEEIKETQRNLLNAAAESLMRRSV
jgi:F-type H+-transporting ATPase subunit delta